MWIICAYFTKNTPYEEHSKGFVESLKRFNLSYDVTAIDSKGDWYTNIQYKPMFLKQMLKKHYPNSIVFVDVDAIFCRYPEHFNKLDNTPEVNIAVHILDHSKYGRKNRAPEMLSGTIFLKNTPTTKQIVDKWIQECKKNPKLWDQRALATVLKSYNYYLLPEEYVVIFDYMSSVKNPVIKHFQASRENRRGTNIKRRQNTSVPRRVVRNGVIRIKRAN